MPAKTMPWVFYSSEMGRRVVLDEIEKLGLGVKEIYLLEQTLKRIELGAETWRDSKHLGRDIWEARTRLPQRQIRILYSIEHEWSLNLAFLAAIKKVQKVPPQWITLALKRRKDWLHRMNDDK